MIRIEFDEEIRKVAPHMRVLALEAQVNNGPTADGLWDSLCVLSHDIKTRYEMSGINKRPGIAATRAVYKALGKDPNRYRPSAEALCRRAVKGLELYRINTLVDIINYISMSTGYSIGGFDAGLVQGDVLRLGRGHDGEDFEGIGRGPLNIEGLPVYRDAVGGIGTPTSDNERTKLTISTGRLLMLVNIYGQEVPDEEVVLLSEKMLTEYAGATNINIHIFTP